MTEQDVRRLTAVADLYAEVDPDAGTALRRLVERAKVTVASKFPREIVTMNSRFRLEGRQGELSLVYPWAESPERVSVISTLGRALLGARLGAKIRDGTRTMTLAAIPYQPEAAGDHHL